jgi:hypothetical protein
MAGSATVASIAVSGLASPQEQDLGRRKPRHLHLPPGPAHPRVGIVKAALQDAGQLGDDVIERGDAVLVTHLCAAVSRNAVHSGSSSLITVYSAMAVSFQRPGIGRRWPVDAEVLLKAALAPTGDLQSAVTRCRRDPAGGVEGVQNRGAKRAGDVVALLGPVDAATHRTQPAR